MSQRKARAARKAQGGLVRHQKQPTPIIDAAYIQAPVGYDAVKREYTYRSPKQVRRYLERRGLDTVALEAELEDIMASYVAAAEDVEAA